MPRALNGNIFKSRSPNDLNTIYVLKTVCTKGFRDGDVSDDGDERYDQDAGLEALRHVEEGLRLVANGPRKRGWLDGRETSDDVTREDVRRSTAVRFEDVRRHRAKDDHESVPGRADRPEESSQPGTSNFFIFQILREEKKRDKPIEYPAIGIGWRTLRPSKVRMQQQDKIRSGILMSATWCTSPAQISTKLSP